MGERKQKEPEPSIECMRPHDVARELGISRDTVLRLLMSKKLPGFKIGRNWMVRRVELESYLTRLSKSAQETQDRKNEAV